MGGTESTPSPSPPPPPPPPTPPPLETACITTHYMSHLASGPRPRRRRRSKDIPPHMSEFMNKLKEHAASFIREFDSREQKMRELAGMIQTFADREVRLLDMMAHSQDMAMMAMMAHGHYGHVLDRREQEMRELTGMIQTFADREVRLLVHVLDMMGSGGAAAAARSFMEIGELLKKNLEEIKRTCEELEQRSAELQARITLTDMEVLQRTLTESGDGREILILPHLCSRVVDDCKKMKEELSCKGLVSS
ncbi:uncharacterized protein LOC120545313 [Perca fluviatilis]|uniref:uncharacterized protein LOC120545313 n=1 Tax=Perca fluviatilis TaxID=8168 RepID=UPI001963013E|nr:uncharacterized protein LOC120545313 [Perca fluviatilis]XP_039635494.1 uncharacterized protein LOC120545313 [Perca fluviatilis]